MTNPSGGTENLALFYQEVLKDIARLFERPTDFEPEKLRADIWAHLESAKSSGKKAGYRESDLEMADLAISGFADEAAKQIKTANPRFAEWREIHTERHLDLGLNAGDQIYANIDLLLDKDVAPDENDDLKAQKATLRSAKADVLEVHYLCLLLGFRGKFGVTLLRNLFPERTPRDFPMERQKRSSIDQYKRDIHTEIERIRQRPSVPQPLPTAPSPDRDWWTLAILVLVGALVACLLAEWHYGSKWLGDSLASLAG